MARITPTLTLTVSCVGTLLFRGGWASDISRRVPVEVSDPTIVLRHRRPPDMLIITAWNPDRPLTALTLQVSGGFNLYRNGAGVFMVPLWVKSCASVLVSRESRA